MPHHRDPISIPDLLRTKGFRVTKGKVALLQLLLKIGQPVSIQEVLSLWQGKTPVETTLYRSLADLSEAGIVRRIDLNTGTAHFEYSPHRPHHHHVVCTHCGVIEEIEQCSVSALQKKIIRDSSRFEKILTHNLEFFGLCLKCSTP